MKGMACRFIMTSLMSRAPEKCLNNIMVINFDINNNECRGDHMEKTKQELARY